MRAEQLGRKCPEPIEVSGIGMTSWTRLNKSVVPIKVIAAHGVPIGLSVLNVMRGLTGRIAVSAQIKWNVQTVVTEPVELSGETVLIEVTVVPGKGHELSGSNRLPRLSEMNQPHVVATVIAMGIVKFVSVANVVIGLKRPPQAAEVEHQTRMLCRQTPQFSMR